MIGKFASLLAGVAMLGGVGAVSIANADVLSEAQLDQVAAGCGAACTTTTNTNTANGGSGSFGGNKNFKNTVSSDQVGGNGGAAKVKVK